jgi:hypothetical protein
VVVWNIVPKGFVLIGEWVRMSGPGVGYVQ